MTNEVKTESFWSTHPNGSRVEGVAKFGDPSTDFIGFMERYDAYRYQTEPHILRYMDALPLNGAEVLEIGLGQGADSEQLIRRGAHWHGIDLTEKSVEQVKKRLALKQLPYRSVHCGSATKLPYADNSFDIVYSFGVLHHVPDIAAAQREIKRVLKPGGQVLVGVYAKHSLNYWLSIFLLRRLGLLTIYPFKPNLGYYYQQHMENAKRLGLLNYLRMEHFIHANTDGPENPYSKLYTRADIAHDFSDFQIIRCRKECLQAWPIPKRWVLPGGSIGGWYLMALLKPKKDA